MLRHTLIASALLAAGAAHAELVTNGGFETGDFSGWMLFGDTDEMEVVSGFTVVHSGARAGAFGPIQAIGGIEQTLATVAGASYEVSFWLRNGIGSTAGRPPNEFRSDWDGGADEVLLTDAGAFDYIEYRYSLVATSASTSLRFEFFNPPSFWFLDDVSVVTAAVAPVPEPASLALAALALAGAAAISRRRRG